MNIQLVFNFQLLWTKLKWIPFIHFYLFPQCKFTEEEFLGQFQWYLVCTVRLLFTKIGSISKVTSSYAMPIILHDTGYKWSDSLIWEKQNLILLFSPLLKKVIYIYIFFFFLLLKDRYFMFLASSVQDYYPDIFLIMMLNVDIGLKTAVFLLVFCNTIYFLYM